jgi:thiol-disulfide isomerase/thioredoxin
MTKFYFFLFAFLCQCNLKAQSYHSTFTLEGNINIDTGKMVLLSLGDFYPHKKDARETTIINGKFRFSDSISYPYAFRLIGNEGPDRKYFSDIFIIDSGIQNIECHIDSLREVPGINNRSMREMNNEYKKHHLPVEKALLNYRNKRDSLYGVYNNKLPLAISTRLSSEYSTLINYLRLNLLSYVKDHPDSFVGLWKLIGWLGNGYEPIYDSIYDQFSVTLKNTYAGKATAKNLKSASIVSIGNNFPRFLFLNTKDKKELFSIDPYKKYTLIDFWFSHCFPCLSEFAELKNLFEKYNNKGFDIRGISVDTKENKIAWKNVIKQYNLPWKQYLDLDHYEAEKLSIDAFPTNFLLNEKGKIIAKNIQPDELKKVLEEKLK